MGVRVISSDDRITAYLSGDLDHHTARDMRMEIDKEIDEKPDCKLIEIDFSAVSFMDSSGIGLIMGRYKLMSRRGGRVEIHNPPVYIARVMNLAGIGKLAKITYTAAGTDEGLNEIITENEGEKNEDESKNS